MDKRRERSKRREVSSHKEIVVCRARKVVEGVVVIGKLLEVPQRSGSAQEGSSPSLGRQE